MANLYYLRVKQGKTTLAQVPKRWREQVQAMIEAEKLETGDEA